MAPGSRFPVLIVLATIGLAGGPAAAQMIEFASVEATTDCLGPETDIHITFTIHDTVDPDITGWVIEREVIGTCVEIVDVGDVRPLPTEPGTHEFVVRDAPVVPGCKEVYYIKAVSTSGERLWIPFPHRGWFAQSSCFDVAARGTVIDMGGYLHLEVCPGECWWGLSIFDNSFPPDQELPPLGATIDVYGTLMGGMEGPYIDATHWFPAAAPCDVVDNERSSWGSLRARYR